MVRILKGMIKEEWPEEFGHIHVPAVSRQEALDCFLRSRIRERKGWKQPEEEMRAERRRLLRMRIREAKGWDQDKADLVAEDATAAEAKGRENAYRRRRLLTALDQEFGPVIPEGQTSRKPVLRLIQGGRKS